MDILSLSKDQIQLSQARENLSKLVDEIDQGARPGVSIIKDGQSRVVMLSTEMYEQLMHNREEILESILSAINLDRALDDYHKGKVTAPRQFFESMAKKYGDF